MLALVCCVGPGLGSGTLFLQKELSCQDTFALFLFLYSTPVYSNSFQGSIYFSFFEDRISQWLTMNPRDHQQENYRHAPCPTLPPPLLNMGSWDGAHTGPCTGLSEHFLCLNDDVSTKHVNTNLANTHIPMCLGDSRDTAQHLVTSMGHPTQHTCYSCS